MLNKFFLPIYILSIVIMVMVYAILKPSELKADLPDQESLEQAVNRALTITRQQTKNDNMGLFSLKQVDDWVFGLASVGVPEGVHGSPDMYLFIGQKMETGWDIAIEFSPRFQEWVQQVPTRLISDIEKPYLIDNQQTRGNGSSKLGLPWKVGETWSLTGGPHATSGNGSRPWSALDFAGGSMLVRAAQDGIAYVGCRGAAILIKHANGWQTGYYHVIKTKARSGQRVKRGDILGTAGTATPNLKGCGGRATGPHVHFTLRRNNVHQEIRGHDIGGWTVSETSHYNGCMTKNNTKKCNFYGGSGRHIYNDGMVGSVPVKPISDYGYWDFNEGSGNKINNKTDNLNKGTIYGANWVNGKKGKALQFDGVDDYIEIPHSNMLNLSKGMTIAAWVKYDSLCGKSVPIVQKDNSYGLKLQNSHPIGFIWGDYEYHTAKTSLQPNTWYHLAATYDGKKHRIYVNGVIENETESNLSLIPSDKKPLHIGKGTYGCNFNGVIDDIYIYRKALSINELKKLCDNCVPPPPTTCGLPITPNFSEAFGAVNIDRIAAPVGALVEAVSPRNKVVGCFTVTQAGKYGAMRIYGEDSSVRPAIPGMRAGETVSFRVNGQPATASPAFTWQNDKTSHQADLNTGLAQQTLTLKPGWNLVSFNVEPTNPATAQVLKNLSYSRVLGQSGSYVPTLPASFNSLKELHAGQGYYIYINGSSTVTLRVEGTSQTVNKALPLQAGWNWIGYLPQTAQSVPQALASIQGKYQRVLGTTGTYMPSLPAFSTLTELQPGQGYLIFMNEAATLTYPATGGRLASLAASPQSTCPAVKLTPYLTLIYGEISLNGQPAPVGTSVEIVGPRGGVGGCSVVQQAGKLGLTAVYGYDKAEGVDGFRPNQRLTLRVKGDSLTTDLRWQNDKDVHQGIFDLTKTEAQTLFIPIIMK